MTMHIAWQGGRGSTPATGIPSSFLRRPGSSLVRYKALLTLRGGYDDFLEDITATSSEEEDENGEKEGGEGVNMQGTKTGAEQQQLGNELDKKVSSD
jgi:hypothetical protein